ncbi:BTAD domain-containing putative transcriptional regulator [Thermopolyspora sp. NPDC052614]|uniref:BTAD domain-containing putative transcriptional regulator n=1 Tax=Thermopolyspora sp. NPDC052614 TaxID=3155682 RepID=UPI003439D369
MLTFHVLGPFEVRRGGSPIDLGGHRQQSVLARLVVAGGRAVPMSVLIDELWPGEPPTQALSTIQGYVSRLRRALEPDRAPREEAAVLVSAPPGYALRTDAGQVDAWRFEDLVKNTPADDAARVWERMGTAVGLWRGPALAEFAELGWAKAESLRLDALRLVAVERRAEAGLRLGEAPAIVPDLEAHASAHPLREEAWRLLALALYRAKRQGDALGALRRARTLLREELGLDLGVELQRLERDILAQAPHLDVDRAAAPNAASGAKPGTGAMSAAVRDAGSAIGPDAAAGSAPGSSADSSGEPGPSGVNGILRVAVADDQALVRTGLRTILNLEPGLEHVGEAEDGERAIALVRDVRPDIVLMDIQMPRLDGLAAARRILADGDPPKVIVMTTFGTDENLYAALRAGVSGFVLKTSPPERLVAAIRAAAEGSALIDPVITTRLIASFAGHSDPAAPAPLAGLPDADLDLIKLVVRGLTNAQIAETLAVPEADVAARVTALLHRLGLLERAQLVVLAYETGLVTPRT